MLASGKDVRPSGLAVDATRVYWTNYRAEIQDDDGGVSKVLPGSVVACVKPACSGAPAVLVVGEDPGLIVVDAVNAYWVVRHITANLSPTYDVVKCGVGGCAGAPSAGALALRPRWRHSPVPAFSPSAPSPSMPPTSIG